MRALACEGSEVTRTSKGTTGGSEPSERHERTTYPMLRRTVCQCGMAYGGRPLGLRSFRSSQRTGKPSTRAAVPTGEGKQVASGQGHEVREMRRAATILRRIHQGNWRAG